MAAAPKPVVTIQGTITHINVFDVIVDKATGESRQAARAQVRTEPLGGFAEVYIAPDYLDVALPGLVADKVDTYAPSAVEWLVGIGIWNRVWFGDEDKPREDQRRYPTLAVSFMSTGQRQLTKAAA